MRPSFLIAVGLSVSSGAALAQNCGGMVNVNGVCIPPDQESSPLNDSYGNQGSYSAPVIPRAKWVDSWGAIATDGVSVAGAVTDFPSKQKAKKAALDECRKRGGGKCVVKTVYKNQCAVIIAGEAKSATANAPTEEEATELGMQTCKRTGAINCRVYYSGCSLAKRVW